MADTGRSVQVAREDEIVLRLPENPTTGYRWHIDRADGLVVTEWDAYQPCVGDPDPDVQIGRGRTREFRFRPEAIGTSRLELKHWQEWEGEASTMERFSVSISVAR